jgi:cell division septation protein DedD
MDGFTTREPGGERVYTFGPNDYILRRHLSLAFDNAIAALVQDTTPLSGFFTKSVIVNTPGAMLDNATIQRDLIIAEGVQDGNVFLYNVNLVGNLLLRAGGSDSVHITGTSAINNIVVDIEPASTVTVRVGPGARINAFSINSGQLNIVSTGNFTPAIQYIEMANNTALIIDNAVTVAELEIKGNNATVTVQGIIEELIITGNNVELVIAENGHVYGLIIYGESTRVENKGSILAVSVLDNVLADLAWGGEYPEHAAIFSVMGEGEWEEVVPEPAEPELTESPDPIPTPSPTPRPIHTPAPTPASAHHQPPTPSPSPTPSPTPTPEPTPEHAWVTATRSDFVVEVGTLGSGRGTITLIVVEVQNPALISQYLTGEPSVNQYRFLVEGQVRLFHRHIVAGRVQYRLAIEGIHTFSGVEVFR